MKPPSRKKPATTSTCSCCTSNKTKTNKRQKLSHTTTVPAPTLPINNSDNTITVEANVADQLPIANELLTDRILQPEPAMPLNTAPIPTLQQYMESSESESEEEDNLPRNFQDAVAHHVSAILPDLVEALPLHGCDNVTIVTRQEWGGRSPRQINDMGTPVEVVFIHHTDMRECFTQDACVNEMRLIQNYDMDSLGKYDIVYNFLIGEDGKAYEGRAWNTNGASVEGWNNVAVAFAIMGGYSHKHPNNAALHAVKAMIECGVQLGKLTPDYKIHGHRDVHHTNCPGDRLYELIKTWNHFDTNTPVKPDPKPYVP